MQACPSCHLLAGHDEKASEASMSALWGLLGDMMGEARARAGTPSAGSRYVEALLAGARKHLERGHQAYIRTTITRFKVCGAYRAAS